MNLGMLLSNAANATYTYSDKISDQQLLTLGICGGALIIIIAVVVVAAISSVVSAVAAETDTED